ncbi:MAG: hypothetical protein IKD11_03535 [Oscillospiraceae bacterium]|nr:hypothetical protein [Oscillospiraceae bacterium]
MCKEGKKCSSLILCHPVICGMVAGFAVIGVWGVVMAVKNKGDKLKKAAEDVGCACVEGVKNAAEGMMESGINMVNNMMPENKDKSAGQ